MAKIESLRLEMGVIAIGDEVAYSVAEGTLSKGKVTGIFSVQDDVFDVAIEGVGLVDSKFIFCEVNDLIVLHLGGSVN